MTEMTPEKPRLWTPADCRIAASNARLGGHSDVGEAFDLIAFAWEADLARIEELKETDAGKLQAEVDGTIRVQMSYIATLESRIEALKKAAREYADAVIEGNATLGQQKRLHDLLDQKGRPR